MKDLTEIGPEPVRTPVAGVDWAGQTELGEVTLSDQDTIVLERSVARMSDLGPLGERSDGERAEAPARHGAAPLLAWATPFLRAWSVARSSLLGAVACGILGGLLVALLLVLLVRLARAERREEMLEPETSVLNATIHVLQPSGAPVPGALIESAGQTIPTDDRGVALFDEPIREDQHVKSRFRFDLVCPQGMRAKEESRELLVSVGLAKRPQPIERSLTFICESTRLSLRLSLRVEGGEGRFWLGKEELGSTTGGGLEKVVQVEKRSEKVLRFEPTIPKGETRKPRVVPEERTIVVLDDAAHVEQTVRIDWPRRRIRSKPKAIPYRL